MKTNKSHPSSSLHALCVQSRNSQWITRTSRVMTILCTIAMLLALPAHAQEKENTESPAAPTAAEEETTTLRDISLEFPIAYRYQPEYCDFTAAFPEDPLISEQCEKEGDPSTCYKLVSYTKVIEMASTVDIKIICNPATPEMYKHFTPKAMEDTVREMTKDKLKETFNVNSTQREGYRLSGLVGQGRKGLHDTLFIAQLWLSEKSIMSVEAEVSGPKLPEVDTILAGILNNLGYAKEMLAEEEPEKEETTE